MKVRVKLNFIETNFQVITSSHSETLFFAMEIIIAINTNREIKISIAIHTAALLSISQNSYYQIVTFITPFVCSLTTMFVVSCILFAQLSIIAANTSQVPQQNTSI